MGEREREREEVTENFVVLNKTITTTVFDALTNLNLAAFFNKHELVKLKIKKEKKRKKFALI
jgi:hypothetical protein